MVRYLHKILLLDGTFNTDCLWRNSSIVHNRINARKNFLDDKIISIYNYTRFQMYIIYTIAINFIVRATNITIKNNNRYPFRAAVKFFFYRKRTMSLARRRFRI